MNPDTAVAEALRNSPQIRALKKEWEAKRIGIEREKPLARPTVDAKLSGTAQGNPVRFPRPDGTQATFLPDSFVRLELTVEQLVYRPGIGAARVRYRAQTAAADEEFRKAQGELALNVRKAYLDLLRAEAGVRQAEQGFEAALRLQKLVAKQIEAGFAKPVDAGSIAAGVAEANAGKVAADNGLMLAKMNLNRLLGRSLDSPLRVSQSNLTTVEGETLAVATETALKLRPEIRLLDANLQETNAGVSLAKTQSQPSLFVRGQAAEQTPTALLPQTYYGVTLEVRIPIFDGGKAKSETAEARAQAERLVALHEETVNGIKIEVTEANLRRNEMKARQVSAKAKSESANALTLVAERAYEVGRGTLADLQNAQRDAQTAQNAMTTADYDAILAAVRYRHVQGLDAPELIPLSNGAKKR